jgi:5'-deoxynucleotidase YfbR-like HD superfamily hydrolase
MGLNNNIEVDGVVVPPPDFRAPLSTWPGGSTMWVAGSKKWVDPLNMRMHDIDIEDIALALSNICRYTGHVARLYSVAEHSVKVSARLQESGYGPAVQLAGLLHDAAEAYLSDVPKPIKDDKRMLWFRELDDRLTDMVMTRFGAAWSMYDRQAVKDADKQEFFAEWPEDSGQLSALTARTVFRARFVHLVAQM